MSDKSTHVIKLIKKPIKTWEEFCNDNKKDSKAHFFQFETWKASLDSMYIVDCVFVLLIAVCMQLIVTQILDVFEDLTGKVWL